MVEAHRGGGTGVHTKYYPWRSYEHRRVPSGSGELIYRERHERIQRLQERRALRRGRSMPRPGPPSVHQRPDPEYRSVLRRHGLKAGYEGLRSWALVVEQKLRLRFCGVYCQPPLQGRFPSHNLPGSRTGAGAKLQRLNSLGSEAIG